MHEIIVACVALAILAIGGLVILYGVVYGLYREFDQSQFDKIRATIVSKHAMLVQSSQESGDYYEYIVEVSLDTKNYVLRGNPRHTYNHYRVGHPVLLIKHRKLGYICEEQYRENRMEFAGVLFVVSLALIIGSIVTAIAIAL